MVDEAAIQTRIRRLIAEDAVGQLQRRDGQMAMLGSEDGALKLDWVEGVARLLADPALLTELEVEARAIRDRGIRHIIWTGMGGSVLTVRVLRDLGFCGGADSGAGAEQLVTIHPLDSTDPAALNEIVRLLAADKGLPLPIAGVSPTPEYLQSLLSDVMMVGVAMGMTSEEPITHLTWFTELLEQAGLPPSEHLLVMTLPGSYLDTFAHEHHAPSRPLQPDGGNGTGGRMSAPATRVFLLPAALYLTGISDEPGQLRAVLQSAWDEYNLALAATRPTEHSFIRLAAALSAVSSDSACRMLVQMPEGWGSLVAWLEQLMEESLGKGGKGIVVFPDQPLNQSAPGFSSAGMLRVQVTGSGAGLAQATEPPLFALAQPSLARTGARDRLSALAASFLDWQLTMALYGYLEGIHFAGQPAVENYKTRARALRIQPDPLQTVAQWRPASHDGSLTLLAPSGTGATGQDATQPAVVFARALWTAVTAGALGYLDVTVNGEAAADGFALLDDQARRLGNVQLGVPVKLRPAPASYHSTEQSEMDGPPYLVSLRLVARETEPCLLGSYTTAFLHAQAVSTWQAMLEANRPCFLLVIDGSLADAGAPLADFLAGVEQAMAGSAGG